MAVLGTTAVQTADFPAFGQEIRIGAIVPGFRARPNHREIRDVETAPLMHDA